MQGIVDAEPVLEDGARLLTVAVSRVSLDGGKTWQAAAGDVEASVSGPTTTTRPLTAMASRSLARCCHSAIPMPPPAWSRA